MLIDIKRLQQAGVPSRYLSARWESITPDIEEPISAYCERIDEHVAEGNGIALLGPYGTGKTFAAVLVLDKVLAADGYRVGTIGDGSDKRPYYEPYTGAFVLASVMSVALHRPSRGDNLERIEEWANVDMLVIDDWHKFYAGGDWDRYQLEALMDRRHAEERATIITLNDMDLLGTMPGVEDRLRESMVKITVGKNVLSRRGESESG